MEDAMIGLEQKCTLTLSIQVFILCISCLAQKASLFRLGFGPKRKWLAFFFFIFMKRRFEYGFHKEK